MPPPNPPPTPQKGREKQPTPTKNKVNAPWMCSEKKSNKRRKTKQMHHRCVKKMNIFGFVPE